MSASASRSDSTPIQGPAFTKGSFCGVCKKSKKDGGDLSDSKLMTCSRCKMAKYCSQDCQKQDLGNHKKDCKWVGHFWPMLSKCEERFQNWIWNKNPNELFKMAPRDIQKKMRKDPKARWRNSHLNDWFGLLKIISNYIKFRYCEKAHNIWNNLPLFLTLAY